MGLESRDYYRNSSGRGQGASGFADMPTVCKTILVANIIVFVLQILLTRPVGPAEMQHRIDAIAQQYESRDRFDDIDARSLAQAASMMPRQSIVQEAFELDSRKVMQGQVWRLVTSAFCHDRFGIWHLLFNMLFLFWFGSRLENMYGPREFALFYFASAIAASVAFIALGFYTGDMTPAIGASGAIWGVLVLYAIHYPYERIRIYFLFPIEIRWLVLLYFVFDLHPVLLTLSGDAMHSGVAHAAHLGGAVFGFGYFKAGWRLERYWDRVPWLGELGNPKQKSWKPSIGGSQGRSGRRRVKSPATIRLHTPETHAELQSKVEPKLLDQLAAKPRLDPELERLELSLDQVLEKIHLQGRESLTDAEVAVLEKASRKYRGDD
ncbi:Rhomboid protease GluP [Rubripirellula amarantea]|uniref:Rhomboid protease GluP n=1 Tax=Rubripirellula amarantea TaxID=2527999 RepID=A0A5C5WAZ2_9BACT|nr:rhomboid family intramembrane serine protease [Rubripirellula amarantea]TWT48086.1 Rhomboid protease GluP [Rubripirellula amarantea]